MKAHVEEDHYSDASFREMYFRPQNYEINGEINDSQETYTSTNSNCCESQKSASELYCDYSESMCQTHGEHSGANNVASDNISDAMEVNR